MAVRRVQRWVGAALVFVAGVLLTGTALTSAPVPEAPPGPPPAPLAASEPTPVPRAAHPTVPRPSEPAAGTGGSVAVPPGRVPRNDEMLDLDMRPERLRIAALGIDRPLVPLRVLEDGSMQAPRRYSDVGWWKDGPLPGTEGNAVVVGHVDSETGPAVFYGLASLNQGDQLTMTRRDASAVRFRVHRVQRFPLTDFPADRVYRRVGPAGLVLITCGGRYDRAAGRYLDNVVVFADRVRDRRSSSGHGVGPVGFTRHSPTRGPDGPRRGRPEDLGSVDSRSPTPSGAGSGGRDLSRSSGGAGGRGP